MLRKFFKGIFRLCVILGFLAVLLILGANQILQRTADSYRGDVEKMLSSELGMPVTIQKLSARLRPFPEISVTNLSIGANPAAPPIEIASGNFRLRLWPLLARRLAIESATFEIPTYKFSSETQTLELKEIQLQARLGVDEAQTTVSKASITARLNEQLIEFFATGLHFDHQSKTILVDDASLTLGKNRIAIKGSGNVTNSSFNITMPTLLLDPTALNLLLTVSGTSKNSFPTVAGVSGNLQVTGSLLTQSSLSGSLKLVDIKYGAFDGLKSANFQNLKLSSSGTKITAAQADIAFDGLKLVTSEENYEAGAIDGHISVDPIGAKTVTARGKLNVTGFGFSDGKTTIKNTNAGLSSVEVVSDKNGSITATVEVIGSQFQLENDSVRVEAVKSLTAPLVITVPAGAGYTVSGPVSFTGAEITTLSRPLKDAHGSITILVSKAVKRFTNPKVSFTTGILAAQFKSDLEMLPDRYILHSFDTDLAGGSLRVDGTLERSQKRKFLANFSAENLDLATVSVLADPSSTESTVGTEPTVGTVEHLEAVISGEAAAFPDSVTGSGKIKISQPEGKKSRLNQMITGALRTVPNLGTLFGSDAAATNDRQTIAANFKFKAAGCQIEKATMNRDNYTMQATGTIGFDKSINARADVIMLQKSAAVLGLGIGPINRLFGQAAKIVIPIVIRGSISEPKVDVDLVQFLKNNSGIGLGEDLIRGIGDMLRSGEK